MMILRHRLKIYRGEDTPFEIDCSVRNLENENLEDAPAIGITSSEALNDMTRQPLGDLVEWEGRFFEVQNSRLFGASKRLAHYSSIAVQVRRVHCEFYERAAASGSWGNTGGVSHVAEVNGRLFGPHAEVKLGAGKEEAVEAYTLRMPVIEEISRCESALIGDEEYVVKGWLRKFSHLEVALEIRR